MQFIFPPRPRGALPPKELSYYEGLGIFVVQNKLQGSRAVVHVKDGRVEIGSRHGRPFKNYTLTKQLRDEVLALPGLNRSLEYWLDGELLIKTTAKDTKGKLVLFDVLQCGKYLFLQPNLLGRLKLLEEICGNPTELDSLRGMAFRVSDNILMIKTIYSDFENAFNKKYGDEVEGLVLKKKNSVLDNFGQKEYEVDWIIRCRHPFKAAQF